MTRQENILTLNEHLDHWKRLLSEKICDQSEGEKTIDALQNAIKALEQEPCGDAVSRRAVNEIINDAYYLKIDDGAALQESIHQLPSVTPQPKMGRWVEEDMFDGDVAYRCTNCNGVFSLIDGTPKDNEYNYCPNCGSYNGGNAE